MVTQKIKILTYQLLSEIVVQLDLVLNVIKEKSKVLLGTDWITPTHAYVKKVKALGISLLAGGLFVLARVGIKGNYTTLWLWTLVALVVATLVYLGTLWMVDFMTNKHGALSILSVPAVFSFVFLTGVSLFLDFQIRRVTFASMFLGIVLFYVLFLYILLLAVNILNVALFKHLPLSRLAEKVLLFTFLLLGSVVVFINLKILAAGYIYSYGIWVILALIWLAFAHFVYCVVFYFLRDFKQSLLWAYLFVLGILIFFTLGVSVGIAFFRWFLLILASMYFLWEALEMYDNRTEPRHLEILGLILTALFLILLL